MRFDLPAPLIYFRFSLPRWCALFGFTPLKISQCKYTLYSVLTRSEVKNYNHKKITRNSNPVVYIYYTATYICIYILHSDLCIYIYITLCVVINDFHRPGSFVPREYCIHFFFTVSPPPFSGCLHNEYKKGKTKQRPRTKITPIHFFWIEYYINIHLRPSSPTACQRYISLTHAIGSLLPTHYPTVYNNTHLAFSVYYYCRTDHNHFMSTAAGGKKNVTFCTIIYAVARFITVAEINESADTNLRRRRLTIGTK